MGSLIHKRLLTLDLETRSVIVKDIIKCIFVYFEWNEKEKESSNGDGNWRGVNVAVYQRLLFG